MNYLGLFSRWETKVYELSFSEWNDRDTKNDCCMYKVGSDLWFHDQRVGKFKQGTYEVINHTVKEDEIDTLIRLYGLKEEEKHNRVEYKPAEMEPQVEEELVKESVDAGTAVDEFMGNWKVNIDKEIAIMKADIDQLEREMLSAAN